jgi:hypothetical protein
VEPYLHFQLRDGVFRYVDFTFIKRLCGEFQFVLFCNMSDTRSHLLDKDLGLLAFG